MAWRLKVSQTGKDVLNCTDDELIFNSDLNIIKVAYHAITTTGGEYTHGLGYIPAFFCQLDNSFLGQATNNFYYSTSTKFIYNITPCSYYLFYQNV